MEIKDSVAVVTGGASGLGEATVRNFVEHGAKAVILDMAEKNGNKLAGELGDSVIFVKTDVASDDSVKNAINLAVEKFGSIQIVVNCAGIAVAQKVLGKNGPMPLENFNKVIQVNLIGTFNVIRLAVEKMVQNIPNRDGERGVIINTASVAAFEGQIGQAAYSASKGGVVGMILPIAREFAAHGIRVMGIAPGLFETPMFDSLPEAAREALGKMTPFPPRLGRPSEFAMLVQQIVGNPMLNGATIRLDGAIRMQPK
ncbi:3-hydroxyacyl-CoA dehydrogenase [Desulfoscipio geothermicus]|uniref:NAD(P)-dependent dehydrogenase, short-chain alcohol dehydrogenase family n=1 Tax=Desulfoscipio geothermicus DSM 3669 TaxID=1121426 RepID=A0A1I6CQH2_9FIRM|nr:3-hydroxyacyl-CoA dehydrogenase [Desulfoscipio geothermicus]SFQ95407.1 NAD(P)-dependent dehydrogenase, short-chain alcohol dehydrogenase family [Desulfoscipio geothermicus DSM 3669]